MRKDKFTRDYLTNLAWLAIFFTAVGLTAGSVPNAAPAEPNAPAESAAGGVAVTINGFVITESQIEAQIKPQLEKLSTQAQQLPPEFIEQFKQKLRRQVLERMIVEQLLDEKVKASNIKVTEEEVTEQLKEMASVQSPPLSLQELRALIEAHGQSFDKVKVRIRKGLSYQKLMEAQWGGKINVTEDDSKKYYSEHKDEFGTPEQVRASHILIKPDTTDPNTDPNQAKAKAKAKAQDLLKKIKDGADFEELARANSACPSAARGGDLNFGRKATLGQRGTWVAPFEKAAFELEVGEVSDVVETQYGYHIIKVTDHKDPNIITFEQAGDDISKKLKRDKQSELARQYIESLRSQADIVYPPGKEPNSVPPRPPR